MTHASIVAPSAMVISCCFVRTHAERRGVGLPAQADLPHLAFLAVLALYSLREPGFPAAGSVR